MDELWDIPNEWKWVGIKTIGDVVSGGTPPTKESSYWSGSISWLSPSDLTGYTSKTISRGAKSITEEGLKHCSAKQMPSGSVHFTSRAPIGYVAISSQSICTNQGFKSIVPARGIFNEYLYYYLKAAKHIAEERATGTTFREISGAAFGKLPIPIAPTNEQHRIVEKIEELFSELDKGIESLSLAREQIKVFRMSLIDAALNTSISGKELVVPLSGLIGKIQQGWSPKCELIRPVQDGDWAVIKTTALQPMKYLSHECKLFPEDLKPRATIEIKVGDLLMTRKGPRKRTGVVCLVRETRKKSMLCDTVYRFRCDETKVAPEYLELVLNSPYIVSELDRRKSGISDSGISLNHGKIKSLPIKIIGDVKEQRSFVRSLGIQLEAISKAEQELEEQLQRSEGLRQSILKKAFTGRLVPQEPKDEPASVLLNRIARERAEAANKAKAAKPARKKVSRKAS